MFCLLWEEKQDRITAKDPCPPWHFLYPRETKSWWCEGVEGEVEEKVSMLTHATARGVDKNTECLAEYTGRTLLKFLKSWWRSHYIKKNLQKYCAIHGDSTNITYQGCSVANILISLQKSLVGNHELPRLHPVWGSCKKLCESGKA